MDSMLGTANLQEEIKERAVEDPLDFLPVQSQFDPYKMNQL